jgi:Spy/CpxP family protein refolding chaperone
MRLPAAGGEEEAGEEEKGTKGGLMFFRLLLAGILATTMASAQRGGGGKNAASGPIIPMNSQPDKLTTISDNLKLDKDQKKLVKTILDEGQKEAAPLRDEAVKSRQAIGEAVVTGKSQDQIDQLVKSHAAIESQMAGIEMKTFVKIYQGLDKDQQPRAQVLFQMMNGIFKGKNWNE